MGFRPAKIDGGAVQLFVPSAVFSRVHVKMLRYCNETRTALIDPHARPF